MGYRIYLGKFSKKEYNKIAKLNEKDMIEFYKNHTRNEEVLDLSDDGTDDYILVHRIPNSLFEISNYYWVENRPVLNKGNCKLLFKNKELIEKYECGDAYVVTKEWFREFILFSINRYNEWSNRITKESITSISKNCEDLNKGELLYFLETCNILENYNSEDLEDNSLLFNYRVWAPGFILNMIFIYKTFDFKKDVLVIQGW